MLTLGSMSSLYLLSCLCSRHFDARIYSSLAEEYSGLDCATQAAKRHVVGDRLRDVIEVLERKVNFNLLDVSSLLNVL